MIGDMTMMTHLMKNTFARGPYETVVLIPVASWRPLPPAKEQ
jgi:hypothetical protein